MAIQDRCEPLTEAVLLHPLDFDGNFSIGLVQGHLLFSYVALTSDSGRPVRAQAQWFDAGLRSASTEIWLGDSYGASAPQWSAFEGRLHGQVWAWAQPTGDLPPRRLQVGLYTLEPASTDFERAPRVLPIIRTYDSDPSLTPLSIGASSATAGRDATAPAAVVHGRPLFALGAIPESCADFPYFNASRLMVFDHLTESVHQNGADPCSAISGTTSEQEHNPTLLSLSGGALGVFYRVGSADGRLWYSRVGPDLRLLDTPPFWVGSTTHHYPVPGGYQARAVALASESILFTERTEENDTNVCSNLRLVEPDGTRPRHAPWQMPCYLPPGSRPTLRSDGWHAPALSAWLALEPLANGHAALAYGERTSFPAGLEYATRLTSEVEWEEGVFLTTIDGLGRRASELVRVSAPASTAVIGAGTPRTPTSGPYPGEFEVRAASEGDTVVVVWRDLRPDAPGYYGRRYRCRSEE